MKENQPEIAVIGVGGAGINAVVRLRDLGLAQARLIAVDTSAQTLARAGDLPHVLLGDAAGGHGTGGRAGLGAAAAAAAVDRLASALAGLDLACVVAGLAGGTGGGAAPAVARLARAAGAVVVGFGILPFAFESGRRAAAAEAALADLRAACDTCVTLDNRRAQEVAGGSVPLDVALRVADDVIRQAVQGLGEMIGGRGWIDVDWPVLRALLRRGGPACLALGLGRGASPARAAMRAALASPLADMRALAQAREVLVHVAGGADLVLCDTAEALDELGACLRADARMVVGAGCDPRLAGVAQVMLLGAGLPEGRRERVGIDGRDVEDIGGRRRPAGDPAPGRLVRLRRPSARPAVAAFKPAQPALAPMLPVREVV